MKKKQLVQLVTSWQRALKMLRVEARWKNLNNYTKFVEWCLGALAARHQNVHDVNIVLTKNELDRVESYETYVERIGENARITLIKNRCLIEDLPKSPELKQLEYISLLQTCICVLTARSKRLESSLLDNEVIIDTEEMKSVEPYAVRISSNGITQIKFMRKDYNGQT